MAKILVVDDEPHIVELIQFNLELDDNIVDTACDGKIAMEKLISENYDMVVLDVMIPYVDGFDVLKFIRKSSMNKEIPVLMLTAKNTENDKIIGLEGGADDYVTKPFSVKELIARVHALLRRTSKLNDVKKLDTIIVKNLVLDKAKHLVKINNIEIDLTLKEYDILKMLAENINNVVNRDDILNKIWGYDYYGDSRAIDVHIRHIRKKIAEKDENNDYIETIRGIGYKIRN